MLGELRVRRQLKVLGATGELDREQAAIAREQQLPRARAGGVADLAEALQRQVGQQAHTDRAAKVEVGAERAGDDDLVQVDALDPGCAQQQLGACADRALGELDLADVRAREDDVAVVPRIGRAHEHTPQSTVVGGDERM